MHLPYDYHTEDNWWSKSTYSYLRLVLFLFAQFCWLFSKKKNYSNSPDRHRYCHMIRVTLNIILDSIRFHVNEYTNRTAIDFRDRCIRENLIPPFMLVCYSLKQMLTFFESVFISKIWKIYFWSWFLYPALFNVDLVWD